jgi:hypothetical protein
MHWEAFPTENIKREENSTRVENVSGQEKMCIEEESVSPEFRTV